MSVIFLSLQMENKYLEPQNLYNFFFSCLICYRRQIANRIVVDPSLYSEKSSPIMYAVETRENPDAFTVFGGQCFFY